MGHRVEERVKALEARVSELEASVAVLERLLSAAIAVGPAGVGEARPARPDEFEPRLLSMLTTKQHVALQMLVAGKSNAEIAARFGVTENGAKVYLRAIYRKFGVHTRSQAALAVYEELERVSPARYEALSKGIPKDWAAKWLSRPPTEDPYWPLYRMEPNEV